jgi:hypothetical protein
MYQAAVPAISTADAAASAAANRLPRARQTPAATSSAVDEAPTTASCVPAETV